MFERVQMKQLNDHLWLMDDNHEGTGYLIAGSEKALVIDTMNGFENVRAIAATVTDKPVLVINTHGHCDHIYGNVWFDEAMLDEKDLKIAAWHFSMPQFVKAVRQYGLKVPPFRTVKEGDIIDLGGLTAQIISLPGHTPGGICVLLREDRILFTGDGINRHLWMQLEESLPLAELLKNLDRIAFVKEKADWIAHGHAQGLEPVSLFDKLREGVRQLVEQRGTEVTDSDREYDWFGGRALQHEFDENSVIVYTRDKLPAVDMAKEFAVIDSYCGIDCSACGFRKDGACGGCRETEGRPFHMQEGKKCPLAGCCQKKGIRWCADCGDIPCEELNRFSSDPEHGDHPAGARIERLGQLKGELLSKARQGVGTLAVCGLSCGENCFLGEWCGRCGSDYSCCSYAALCPEGKCPNLLCVREKGIEGCWDCPELDACQKGFYGIDDRPAANLAKAGALFIRCFGRSAFSTMLHYILKEKGQRYNDFFKFMEKKSAEELLAAMEAYYGED
ncbi:MAG: hypothetical protein CW338_03955 [Clostridiales bacterium]|nr:hypothetical protein [Clostridiales bacterium]